MAHVCELPKVDCHVAATFKNFIIVFGGDSCDVIWIYNIYTDQWRKQVLPDKQLCPPDTSNFCAVTIRDEIYMFGGDVYCSYTNALWKLTITPREPFIWSNISAKSQEKTPSPRENHSGWEYAGKLWTFGGIGEWGIPHGYLHQQGEFDLAGANNQLLCFDPSRQEWTNLRSSGTIPMHRYSHATATTGTKLWLYGGLNIFYGELDDLYQLNLPTLVWTKIETDMKPLGRSKCSLTAVIDKQLLLYGGYNNLSPSLRYSWVFNISDMAWRLHPTGWDNKYHFHRNHSGTKGIDNSVIITGGRVDTAVNHGLRQNYKIISIKKPKPQSLQILAMKIIFKHQDRLPWNTLPKVLIAQIMFPGTENNHHRSRKRKELE